MVKKQCGIWCYAIVVVVSLCNEKKSVLLKYKMIKHAYYFATSKPNVVALGIGVVLNGICN